MVKWNDIVVVCRYFRTACGKAATRARIKRVKVTSAPSCVWDVPIRATPASVPME